jgi:hypothetical protein
VEGLERKKLESKITRNPTRISVVESPMDESNKLLDRLWVKMMGASDWSDWICQLRTYFDCNATWRHTTYAKDDRVIPILQIIQEPICFRSFEEHQVRLKASDIGQEGIKWFERFNY